MSGLKCLPLAAFLFSFVVLSSSGFPSLCHAQVIFSDDFESGDLADKWDQVNLRTSARGGLETAPEHVHAGKRSLRLTAVADSGKASVAQVVRWFLPGYDRLYFRYYAKFAADFDQGNFMHWTMIGGSRTDNKYSGFGKAGIKPNGTDFFTTMLEPAREWKKYPPPGALQFSTSHPDMKAAKDGVYWTNPFQPDKPFVIERDRWYCFEALVKLNAPGRNDGEQAFWVDGKKLLHAKGIRWRDSEVLKLNFFWLMVYIHQAARDNTCWYDDLVISTEYVGPETSVKNGDGK